MEIVKVTFSLRGWLFMGRLDPFFSVDYLFAFFVRDFHRSLSPLLV